MNYKSGVLVILFILTFAYAYDCACDLSGAGYDGFCMDATYSGTDGNLHHSCCNPYPYSEANVGGTTYTYVWGGYSYPDGSAIICYGGIDTGGPTASGTPIVESIQTSAGSSLSICAGNNGAACDVNPIDGWGGYGDGVCDSSDANCVECDGNHIEIKAWGGGSRPDLESSYADGKCESGCGASVGCDERSPGTFEDVDGDNTIDSCSSTCQFTDSQTCEKDYGAAEACDGIDIGDVCATDYCNGGVLYEYDGAGSAAGDGLLNGQTCSSTCGCDGTLEAASYSLCDTECSSGSFRVDPLCNNKPSGAFADPDGDATIDYCTGCELYVDGEICEADYGAVAACDGKNNGEFEDPDGDHTIDSCSSDCRTYTDGQTCSVNYGADIECSGLDIGDVCRTGCGLYSTEICSSVCGCPPCKTSCSSDSDCSSGSYCDVSEAVCRETALCADNRDGTGLCEVSCGASSECDEKIEGVFGEGEGCNTLCQYDNTPPSNPTLSTLSTYDSDGEVDLSWSASTDTNGIDRYEVISADESPATDGQVIRTLNSSQLSTFDIRQDGVVFYIVRAYDNVGLYSDSNEESTIVDTGVDTPAELDEYLTYSTDGDVISMWSGAFDTNGIDNYILWRKTTGDFLFVTETPASPYPESGLSDETYTYKVETFDSAGHSANSTEKSIIVDSILDTPANLNTPDTYSDATVSLTWNEASDLNGISSYKVWRGTSTGNYDTSFDAATYRDYTDSSVSDSTEYFYVVESFDDALNSAYSNEVSTKVDKTAPIVTIQSPTPSQILSSSPITLTFTSTDASPAGWDNIPDCDWFLDGEVVDGGSTVNATATDKFVTVSGDGSHNLYVICADDAGNSGQSLTRSFIFDTTSPSYSQMSQSNDLPNDGEVVDVSALWHDTYTVDVVTLEANRSGDWESVDTVNLTAANAWSNFTIDTFDCSNNFVTWRLRAFDLAGNEKLTETKIFEIDRYPSVGTVSFTPDDDPSTGGEQLDPIGAGYKRQVAYAVAYDPNGGQDIIEGNCSYFAPGLDPDIDTATYTEDAEVTSKKELDEYERRVSCEHHFAYDDEPGLWTVQIEAHDTKGNSADSDGNFEYTDGVFVVLNSTTIDWGTLTLSTDSVRSNNVIELNNTGNVGVQMYFKAKNMVGVSDPSFVIPVSSIELDDDDDAITDAGNNPIISYSQDYFEYSPAGGDLGVGETWPVWHYMSTPATLADQEYSGSITICAAKTGQGGCI